MIDLWNIFYIFDKKDTDALDIVSKETLVV